MFAGSNFYAADGINRGYTSMSRECLLIDHLVAIGF